MRGRSHILVRCITAVLLLQMITARSGVCHVHTHDMDAHDGFASEDGHGGSCDHHLELNIFDGPEGIPGSSQETGTCCSSSPSSFVFRQTGDIRSAKVASSCVMHVAAAQLSWKGPVLAIQARSVAPPWKTPPLAISGRLRI